MCASVPPSFPAFLPLCHVHVVFVFVCGGGAGMGAGVLGDAFFAEVRRRLAIDVYVPPPSPPSLFAAAVVLVVVVVVVVSALCFNALPPRAVARTGPSALVRLSRLQDFVSPGISPFASTPPLFCWFPVRVFPGGAVLAKGLIPLDTWP